MKRSIINSVVASVICLLTLGLGGCKPSPKEQAQKDLEKIAKEMDTPLKINGATLTEVKYEDNTFVMYNEVSADTLAAINKPELEKRTLKNLREQMGKVSAKIIAADADIEYIYYNGDNKVRFSFTADQLKEAEEDEEE